jgi:hypothetical protein
VFARRSGPCWQVRRLEPHHPRIKANPRVWLDRDDFARFIRRGPGTAAIDWETAIGALDAGELPSWAGEKRMLRLAASLAGQAHVSLGDAITGIDERHLSILVSAVLHAAVNASSQSHVTGLVTICTCLA